MKIISFSLFGDWLRYFKGALANIELAKLYYPGWKCRIYCSNQVSEKAITELIKAGFEVINRSCSPSSFEGLFWRFEPIFEVGVERFISRDCDSRLNPREAAAVREWEDSGKLMHTMRDHPGHIWPIMGGAWGSCHWPLFVDLFNNWQRRYDKGEDQTFLAEKAWPLVRNKDILVHSCFTTRTLINCSDKIRFYDPIAFFGEHEIRPFPYHEPLVPKIHGAFVGDYVWEV